LPTKSNRRLHLGLPVAVFAACIGAGAQQPALSAPAPTFLLPQMQFNPKPDLLAQSILLPNALSGGSDSNASTASARSVTVGPAPPAPGVSRTRKVIDPGQHAPALDPQDKALLGLKSSFTPYAALGWFAAAGYEQWLNDSPNVGTDRGAFGERVGTAVIRDSSEGILSDSVMASVLCEDPRYYRLGPSHRLPARFLYAITRPLITRTDAGDLSPNLALWSGTLGGAALTNAYYPGIDRGAVHTLKIFGGSIGGEAFSDFVREFFGDSIGMSRAQQK
jgi:hypothetical protein